MAGTLLMGERGSSFIRWPGNVARSPASLLVRCCVAHLLLRRDLVILRLCTNDLSLRSLDGKLNKLFLNSPSLLFHICTVHWESIYLPRRLSRRSYRSSPIRPISLIN
nr:hypothetical protein [Solanum melongena]WMB97013.1 hypothetical protein [Solanum aethiopicum]